MKKIMVIILTAVLLFGLTNCSNQKETKKVTVKEINVRETVWKQLSAKDKERIKGTWGDSKIYTVTLREYMGNIKDKSYLDKEVYLIDFTTKDVFSEPNNIVVYATLEDGKIIGYGYVD